MLDHEDAQHHDGLDVEHSLGHVGGMWHVLLHQHRHARTAIQFFSSSTECICGPQPERAALVGKCHVPACARICVSAAALVFAVALLN